MILMKTIPVFLHKKQSYEVDAVQGESGRGLLLQLQDEKGDWIPSEETRATVRFSKPDGTGGIYDTLPDGKEAWYICDNQVAVALAPQVLAVSGTTELQVVLSDGEEELSTFVIHIHVEADPSLGTMKSEDYVNLTSRITSMVNAQLRNAEQTWHRLFDVGMPTFFSRGSLNFGNGQELASDTEIRSDMIVLGGRAVSVVFPSDIWVRCCYYDADEHFVGSSAMFSESFTIQSDAANIRFVACYADERKVADLYGMSQSIGISFPSDRLDAYRGEVVKLGFSTFEECVEDGVYSFENPELILDAPEMSCGGMLAVQSRGSKPAMQKIWTEQGECWFRVGNQPFKRIPVMTAEDVGAAPAMFSGTEEVPIQPDSMIIGRIAWDTAVVNGLEHPEGMYAIYPISGSRQLVLRGYQWQSKYDYYGYVFYYEDGRVISKHIGGPDNTSFELLVDVPDGAATVRINGHSACPMGVSAFEQISSQEVLMRISKEQFKKPKLMLLGDSITQLGTSDRGWAKYFLEATGCELIVNTAVSGATLKDKLGTVYDGNPVFNGVDGNKNNVLGNQVQKILNGEYEAPDIIMIAIGTNDGISIKEENMFSTYYRSDGSTIPLTEVDRSTAAGAYRYCLDTLHNKYPDAVICWCTPILAHPLMRQPSQVRSWAESLRIATEFTGQIWIDTIRCGISGINEAKGALGEYLLDGLHPTEKGAMKIGYYNASKVLPLIRSGFIKG